MFFAFHRNIRHISLSQHIGRCAPAVLSKSQGEGIRIPIYAGLRKNRILYDEIAKRHLEPHFLYLTFSFPDSSSLRIFALFAEVGTYDAHTRRIPSYFRFQRHAPKFSKAPISPLGALRTFGSEDSKRSLRRHPPHIRWPKKKIVYSMKCEEPL